METIGENAPKAEASSEINCLALVLANLVQAVEFTPLGVRGLVAVAEAKTALAGVPASGYAMSEDNPATLNRLSAMYAQLSHEDLVINAVGNHLYGMKQRSAPATFDAMLKQRLNKLSGLSDEMANLLKQIRLALM